MALLNQYKTSIFGDYPPKKSPQRKIALIGRVNVGKSTLFNRIIEEPKALVSKTPGTTRDLSYAQCSWQGKKFILIDSGGIDKTRINTDIYADKRRYISALEKEVQKRIKKAINEADLILFILNVRDGVTPADREIARTIRKSGKPIILVVNKADNQKWRQIALSSEYWQLGFGQPYPISAATGIGVGDLLDEVVNKLIKYLGNQIIRELKIPKHLSTQVIKVTIIGQPNVGKSSLLNSILGEERMIVSPLPQTTRAPEDTLIIYQNQPILFIDTAGLRRKRKVKLEIEQLGAKKSIVALRKSDIVVLVIDINEKISHQDKALVDLVIESKKGLILVINKIDLIRDFDKKFNQFIKYYQWNLPNANWAPIIFVSALTGQNIKKILDLILQTKKNQKIKIGNQELNNFLSEIIAKRKFNQKIWSKIKLQQIDILPPKFILKTPSHFIKRKIIHQTQINIIEKELREKYNLWGTPIEIKIKNQKYIL